MCCPGSRNFARSRPIVCCKLPCANFLRAAARRCDSLPNSSAERADEQHRQKVAACEVCTKEIKIDSGNSTAHEASASEHCHRSSAQTSLKQTARRKQAAA